MKTGSRPAYELRVGDVVSAPHVIGRVVEKIERVEEPGVDAVKVSFRPLYEDKPGLVQYYSAGEMVRVTREEGRDDLIKQALDLMHTGNPWDTAGQDLADAVLRYFNQGGE